MKYGIGFVAMLMLITGLSLAAKPRVRLTANPRISIAGMHGSLITFLLIVEDIDEELYCAELCWDNGVRRSCHEADCVPFEEADPADLERTSVVRRERYGAGLWTMTVTFRKDDKTIRKVWTDFEVR